MEQSTDKIPVESNEESTNVDKNTEKSSEPYEKNSPSKETIDPEASMAAEIDCIPDDEVLRELEAHLTEDERQERVENSEGLRIQGNSAFKEQEWMEAAAKYTAALRICPVTYKKERSVLFANRAAAKLKLGAKQPAIQDCTRAISLDTSYIKAYMRRATLYEELEQLDEAEEDFKHALSLDPTNKELGGSVQRLQHKINVRNEKMKEEAMKGLKSLGNLFLKPFGLSTDNFQMTPNGSGGYSINQKQ